MPSFDIVKQIEVKDSFRVNAIKGMFDLQTNVIKEHFTGTIDIENKQWNIGVIYGKSGSGKTTIAKEIFPDAYVNGFSYTASSVIDDMPKHCSVKEICKVFNAVGFSSPPSWLKSYHILSTGEKMRVDVARAILEKSDLIVFDEFTSTINREVAKIGSFAISKAIRNMNKKFVAVTCHYDILEWLCPDWTFCTDDFSFNFFF